MASTCLAGVSFGASVDHDPMVRLRLHADTRYVNEAAPGDGEGDDAYRIELGASYLVSPGYSLGADYRYLSRETLAVGDDGNLNLFLLRLKLSY